MIGRGGNKRLLRRRWQIDALVIGVYTLFALILTWPLIAHVGHYVPGNGVDDPPLTWNLWWIRHALLDLGTNPFDGDFLFYPLGVNLAFYTLTVLNGLLSIPLQVTLGLVPASNLLLLSSFVLSGYGTFLLSGYLLPRHDRFGGDGDPEPSTSNVRSLLAPFAAGLVYAFAASKLSYAALGQWNIASSQWIPFYALYLFKLGDHPHRWRYPLLAALFLLFQAYAELTFASFLLLLTALWLVWRLAGLLRKPRAKGARRTVLDLMVVGLLSVAGLVPVLVKMIPDMLVEGNVLAEGTGFADVFSADLLGFLIPSVHHPLFGSLVQRFSFDYSVGQHIYLGISVLVMALMGAIYWWRRRSPVRFWSLAAVAFWMLTLGPALRVNGHDTGLPLPFALLARLPFFEGNRYPSRYSVMLFLSLAVLAGFGLAALLQRRGSRSASRLFPVSLALVLLMLFEQLSVPLPLSNMGVPPIYETLAQEMPGDFTLLDLPVAWRNGFRVTGTQDAIIMLEQYYQSVHGKPILAGNTSRNPPLKMQYFTEAPVINTLIALETGHEVDPAVVEQDHGLAAAVLRFLDIEAIFVHPAQTGPAVIPYVETTMPVERWLEQDGITAYRVDLPPWPSAWSVEPGDALARLSYAEGWGVPAGGVIWAQRRATRLLVPLDGAAQRLTFRAYAPEGGQQLRLEVNGTAAGRIEMAAGWMDYEMTLPASVVRSGLNEIWLHFEALVPASQVMLASRTLDQGGVSDEPSGQAGVESSGPAIESPVNLVVQSAGEEVGDFGHIYVDGRDVSPNERGYNIAVLDPGSGNVVTTASFDTHLDADASLRMAEFLRDVPPGAIVAVAAADEASRLLGQEAVDALYGIGAVGDLLNKFRWGQAIIGVQGAPPGSALEAMDWMRPVTVAVGEGATEPNLAAAFATIEFEAVPDP
jgi:hypothetical protein